MMLEVLSSVGEFVAAIAAIAALVYLGAQIRQSNLTARAQARQTLIDTWSSLDWDLARDPQLLKTFSSCMNDWPNVSDEDKIAFELGMGTYLANLANGLLLQEAGLLDKAVLQRVADRMIMVITTPGGSEWWKETTGAWPQVRAYIDQRISSGEATIESVDRSVPYFTDMTKN